MAFLSLVAFDLDGTVIDSTTRTISPRVVRALEAAHNRGALTCVASGRPLHMLGETLLSAPWVDLFITVNGAMVMSSGDWETIAQRTLSRTQSRELFELLADLDPAWQFFLPSGSFRDSRFASRGAERPDRKMSSNVEELERALADIQVVDDPIALFNEIDEQPIKIEAIFPSLDEVEEAGRRLAQRTDISAARMFDVPDYEITAKGVDKGSAMDILLKRYGLDPAEVVAFGDSSNDISMTGRAWHFVAMGNATDELKAAADEVCPSIENDGVAVWLEHRLEL